MSVQLHAAAYFTFVTHRLAGWVDPEIVRRFGEEQNKKPLDPPRIRTLDRPGRSLVSS